MARDGDRRTDTSSRPGDAAIIGYFHIDNIARRGVGHHRVRTLAYDVRFVDVRRRDHLHVEFPAVEPALQTRVVDEAAAVDGDLPVVVAEESRVAADVLHLARARKRVMRDI